MRWVIRHEPHVDRRTLIWLIRTLIDSEAVFDFISRDSPVPAGAIPFALPGAELQPTGTATTLWTALILFHQFYPSVRTTSTGT